MAATVNSQSECKYSVSQHTTIHTHQINLLMITFDFWPIF